MRGGGAPLRENRVVPGSPILSAPSFEDLVRKMKQGVQFPPQGPQSTRGQGMGRPRLTVVSQSQGQPRGFGAGFFPDRCRRSTDCRERKVHNMSGTSDTGSRARESGSQADPAPAAKGLRGQRQSREGDTVHLRREPRCIGQAHCQSAEAPNTEDDFGELVCLVELQM